MLDITPTIYTLFKDNVPEDLEGKSLIKYFISNSSTDSNRTLFFESMNGKEEYNWAPVVGLLTDEYKYISLPKPELYNLIKDPDEKKNLVRSKYRVVNKLNTSLQKFLSDHSAINKNNQRQLSKLDIDHLKSLGYISSKKSARRSSRIIDPKDGILIQNKISKVEELINTKNYSEAETQLLDQINTPERMKISYLFLSEVYSRQNKINFAIDILKKGINAFPDAKNFSMPLAKFLYDNQQYQESLKYAKAAQIQIPLNVSSYILIGDVYFKLNQPEEAFESFETAIKLEPENIPLNMKFADLLIKNNQKDKAINIYERIIKYSSVAKNEEFIFWYAKIMFGKQNISRALELMESLIQLKPTGNYYFFYALMLSQNNQFQKAIDNMKVAINNYKAELTTRQQADSISFINQWKEKIH